MTFEPAVNQVLIIDGIRYAIAEHPDPDAAGMPYGQEGRAAVVYQLCAVSGERRALKVFKLAYRVPNLINSTRHLAPYIDIPGLLACQRIVLSKPRYNALLEQYPDLDYAIMMQWIEGPTWTQVILEHRPFDRETCLTVVHALLDTLTKMEERQIAHCDLSAPNVLLPCLAGGQGIQLIDLEGMYHVSLERPKNILTGSPGYAHETVSCDPNIAWSPEADRFAGAMLLAEILGWCDPAVRSASSEDSYFDPGEMHQEAKRYFVLFKSLQKQYDADVAELFERAWWSRSLSECPSFAEWSDTLARIAMPAQNHPLQAGRAVLKSQSGLHFPITKATTLIGRRDIQKGRAPDIALDALDLENQRTVSRTHARITQRGGTYYLEDLASRNGVYVNGTRLNAPQHRLSSGDRLHFGAVELEFVLES